MREVCLDTTGSNLDTLLYVRTDCADADSEIACNDDQFGTFFSPN